MTIEDAAELILYRLAGRGALGDAVGVDGEAVGDVLGVEGDLDQIVLLDLDAGGGEGVVVAVDGDLDDFALFAGVVAAPQRRRRSPGSRRPDAIARRRRMRDAMAATFLQFG